jgi:hypothetical protein
MALKPQAPGRLKWKLGAIKIRKAVRPKLAATPLHNGWLTSLDTEKKKRVEPGIVFTAESPARVRRL